MSLLFRSALTACLLMLCISPLRAADADQPACTTPDRPLRPVMATHTPAPYPQMSVMTSEEGTTIVTVSIGADGVPTKVTVFTSSGSVRLDDAAVTHIKDNWRWNAPIIGCKPAASETRVSVKWDLKNTTANPFQPPSVFMNPNDYPPDALKRREQGDVTVAVVITAQGQVQPVVVRSSGFSDLDQKSVEVIKGWHFSPGVLEGRPMMTQIFLVSVWKIDGQPK
ncbi:MAG TPA: energy transducer TonB [Rhizomicrobium sp.]|nr:energy transducer TonB [Rhizomicrobium sp.]